MREPLIRTGHPDRLVLLDPAILVVVFLTFLIAGGVKGVVGLGMPTISISLLTATLGLKTAIALALVPAFATNLWQALQGGRLKEILARLWPLLVAGALCTWLAAGVLANADVRPLTILLGSLLALYA
ncbi:MAG: TSUP family transporter, partial [Kiloniellales bacterium]